VKHLLFLVKIFPFRRLRLPVSPGSTHLLHKLMEPVVSAGCKALSVTKLSLSVLFCNALKLSLIIFENVAFCNGFRYNGVTDATKWVSRRGDLNFFVNHSL
jgi:hypothetical protein